MRALKIIILIFLFLSTSVYAEKAPKKIVDMANSMLATYGTNSIIIDAVKKENMKGKTLAQIKEIDEKWKKTPGVDAFMKAMMDSECGKYLTTLRKSKPYFSEIFVMDNLGGNVAMTDKTSDYWQGDEAKFQKAFNNGKGAVFVDEVEFDESSQAYLVQVSVPVKDGDKVIGTITFGIDIDKYK